MKYIIYLQLNTGREGYFTGEWNDGTPKISSNIIYGVRYPSYNAAKSKALRLKEYLKRKYSRPNIVYWEICKLIA